ncbi:MAG: hypothetical protein P1P81_09060, partial [Desulfobulbales bacterium]|nr:hypothetical protein [Desulfobulbales bacterium]
MDKQKSPGLLAVARALLALAGFLALLVQPGLVHAYGKIATRLVRLIHVDDSGLPLGMVSRVRYDPLHQETYVYSSSNRITIYDKDYFPQGSIGPGRGV